MAMLFLYGLVAIGSAWAYMFDPGEPIWQCGTGRAIGLGTWDSGTTQAGITTLLPPEPPGPYEALNLQPFHPDQAPGILNAPGMGDLHISTVQ